jgi:hypothetical protein
MLLILKRQRQLRNVLGKRSRGASTECSSAVNRWSIAGPLIGLKAKRGGLSRGMKEIDSLIH